MVTLCLFAVSGCGSALVTGSTSPTSSPSISQSNSAISCPNSSPGISSSSSSPTPSVSPTAPTWPAGACYVGDVPGPSYDSRVGVSLTTPLPNQTAEKVWTSVFASCLTGDAICDPGVAAVVSLAVATSTSAGHADPSGKLIPLMSNQLVYVLEQDGISCRAAGPAGATQTDHLCNGLNFIDADTGAVMYSVTYTVT